MSSHIPFPAELQKYLHDKIPISEAMGVRVRHLSLEKIVLGASFQQNINHKSTVFGGSLSAIATLACWGLLYANVVSLSSPYEIVVTHADVSYRKPVVGDFEATCTLCAQKDWMRFLTTLERRGKARLSLQATIGELEAPAVEFQGTFAALLRT